LKLIERAAQLTRVGLERAIREGMVRSSGSADDAVPTSRRTRSDQLQALEHSVAGCVAEADSAASALRNVMRLVCDAEHWESGFYLRHDEAVDSFRFESVYGVAHEEIAALVNRRESAAFVPGIALVGQVWKSGEPCWVENITDANAGFPNEFASQLKIQSALLIPVITEDDTLGVLVFVSRRRQKHDDRIYSNPGRHGPYCSSR